ncbi:MAG TPA: hypothetical protein VLV78_13880 [Thermoanaerobaculia bacterium]|nr:hypothetical protein [Thermoanaerobaculia bacterium]
MHLATLLLLTSTLVLRTGERITVEGPLAQRDGAVIFRSGGSLYSLPVVELDADATRAANEVPELVAIPAPRPLKVSRAEQERLLRDLEQNHSGRPAPEQSWQTEPLLRLPSTREVAENSAGEWRWRRDARAFEESVRQAKENLNLLLDQADRLRSEIRGFLSLGFKPQQFTYQTTLLARVEEQIPVAHLNVERAQRAYDQFRDDARRQGIMPGWLR